MRLIDADKIENATASDIEVYSFNLVPYIKVEDLLNFIDNQPTAYDIDKVVEELQESASRHTKKYTTPYGNKGYKDVKAISVNKAIEIVKAGVENGKHM